MSFPKTGLTNKWSTETQVATSQAYENSAKYCLPKDFKYMVYFAIAFLTITGSAALYLGINWKAPTGEHRWAHEIGGTPGEKWYYV